MNRGGRRTVYGIMSAALTCGAFLFCGATYSTASGATPKEKNTRPAASNNSAPQKNAKESRLQNKGPRDSDALHSGPDSRTLGLPKTTLTMSQINDGIKANPRSVELLLLRGNAYCLDTDYDEAKADFDRALQIDPHCAKAHIGLSRIYIGLAKYPEALAELKKAEQVATPEYAVDAIFDSAFLHRELKQYPISIKEYSTVIDSGYLRKKRLAWAYMQRGEAYTRSAKYPEALADYDKALKADPTLTLIYLQQARAYRDSRQYDKAIASYTAVLNDSDPNIGSDQLGGKRGLEDTARIERSDMYVKIGRRDLAAADRKKVRDSEKRIMEIAPFSTR